MNVFKCKVDPTQPPLNEGQVRSLLSQGASFICSSTTLTQFAVNPFDTIGVAVVDSRDELELINKKDYNAIQARAIDNTAEIKRVKDSCDAELWTAQQKLSRCENERFKMKELLRDCLTSKENLKGHFEQSEEVCRRCEAALNSRDEAHRESMQAALSAMRAEILESVAAATVLAEERYTTVIEGLSTEVTALRTQVTGLAARLNLVETHMKTAEQLL